MPVQPAFLTLNRHKTYYFRIVVPKPLRAAFSIQREIRRSLKTDSARLALKRARQYAVRFEAAFDRVLAVVGKDDYIPTDADYELYINEIEQAGSAGAWESHPAEPAQKAVSALSDDDWQKIEIQQRWNAIAEVLTGNTKRAIPKSQKGLADQIYAAGNGIPFTSFRKLLPKLLDELALQQLSRPGETVAAPAPASAPIVPKPPSPTLYELWLLLRETDQRLNRKKSASAHADEQGHALRLTILSGNRPFGSLSLEDINQLYLLTQQVKALRGRKIPPPDSPIESILASQGDDLISGPTIEKMIIRLSVLHKFAYAKGHTHTSNQVKLKFHLSALRRGVSLDRTNHFQPKNCTRSSQAISTKERIVAQPILSSPTNSGSRCLASLLEGDSMNSVSWKQLTLLKMWVPESGLLNSLRKVQNR